MHSTPRAAERFLARMSGMVRLCTSRPATPLKGVPRCLKDP
jgi:hypothetical protein